MLVLVLLGQPLVGLDIGILGRCVAVQAVHMLQHTGPHNRLIVDTGSPDIRVDGRAMTVSTSVAGRSTYCGGGRYAVRWLLALDVRLMQQGELTAAVALQLPSRILEAAIEQSAPLAAGQALPCEQYPNTM
ncbi:uncharacterized protein DMAD_03292 [Drosophila madeirensis]|uniref:Uncharacterized protein n=1 Tax=Drosophila madeirensis TaxID=30013 RepID=A0AAU9G6Y7_DROMD